MRLCSVPGCSKPHFGRGLCSMHHARERRGYKGRGARLGRHVSSEEVAIFVAEAIRYNGQGCLPWPYGRTGPGYGCGMYKGHKAYMHRVVCELVHGAPPPGHEAAHSCGNPLCVSPHHLRWASRAGNQADRHLHNTDTRGERHGRSKLTREDVLAIRSQPHRKIKDLAAEYGVSQSRISMIRHRRDWSWL